MSLTTEKVMEVFRTALREDQSSVESAVVVVAAMAYQAGVRDASRGPIRAETWEEMRWRINNRDRGGG